MSWHDPARANEPAEDRALRDELGQLLGLPVRRFFEAEPTPKMIALAEDLRREAMRRRRTSRQRPIWMLMAAGLPLMFALTALGVWGYQHKRRADELAAATARQEAQIRLLVQAAAEAAKAREAAAPVEAKALAPAVTRVAAAPVESRPRPGELIIEVKPSTSPIPTQTQTVKQRGQ